MSLEITRSPGLNSCHQAFQSIILSTCCICYLLHLSSSIAYCLLQADIPSSMRLYHILLTPRIWHSSIHLRNPRNSSYVMLFHTHIYYRAQNCHYMLKAYWPCLQNISFNKLGNFFLKYYLKHKKIPHRGDKASLDRCGQQERYHNRVDQEYPKTHFFLNGKNHIKRKNSKTSRNMPNQQYAL